MRKIFATIEESVWNSHLRNIATKNGENVDVQDCFCTILCCYIDFVRMDGNIYITSQLNFFLHFCYIASFHIRNLKSIILCCCFVHAGMKTNFSTN